MILRSKRQTQPKILHCICMLNGLERFEGQHGTPKFKVQQPLWAMAYWHWLTSNPRNLNLRPTHSTYTPFTLPSIYAM